MDAHSMEGYMSRQPRFNLRNKNFNFEEFKKYTAMYEEARELDERESKHFYKIVKYVMAKTAEGDSDKLRADSLVQEFNRKYKLELI